MIIGVTGRYCAGKTHFVQSFIDFLNEKRDIVPYTANHIDMDVLGHKVLVESKKTLRQHFGNSIFDEQGSINRRILGDLVFSNPDRLAELETILHPKMKARCLELLSCFHTIHADDTQEIRHPRDNIITIIDAAILFRLKLHQYCNLVVIVRTPAILRFFRSCKRVYAHKNTEHAYEPHKQQSNKKIPYAETLASMLKAIKRFYMLSRIQNDIDTKKNRKILSSLSDYVYISGIQSLTTQKECFYTILKDFFQEYMHGSKR